MIALRFLVVLLSGIFLAGCSIGQQSKKGGLESFTGPEQQSVREALGPKKIALVIGINKFSDRNWPDLKFAVKDARDLAVVLSDPNLGAFDEVQSLTMSADTTKERILNAIEKLSKLNLRKDDTVVLYLSSHGTLAKVKSQFQQYVVASDTRFDEIEESAIRLSELKKAFNRLASEKKVMIFAFCHSGKGKSKLDEATSLNLSDLKAPFFVKPIEQVSEATIILSASGWGETAREDRRLKNDIYTHFLVEGIRGQDLNEDGAVTVTEAHDYAKEKTYYYTQGEQRPSMESVVLGADPIILSGAVLRKGRPLLYDYSDDLTDIQVLVDGERKGSLPLGIPLDAGVRRISLTVDGSTKPFFEESIAVREGDYLSIPVLVYGFNRGLAFRVGYQGFLDDRLDQAVSKPIFLYGLTYTRQNWLESNWALRGDVSFGRDQQTLDLGLTREEAEVSHLALGLAMLYRYPIQGVAAYGGPRAGGLFLSRNPTASGTDHESIETITPGGILGFQFQYKQRVSANLESSIHYANISLNDERNSSLYYTFWGGFSLNF